MAGKHNIKRLSTTYHWFSFNNETYYTHFSAVRSVFVTDHNYILTMPHDALQTCNCRHICVFVCVYVCTTSISSTSTAHLPTLILIF